MLAPDPLRSASREGFRIQDLTREFAVTARTLRFYEEKGLLSPQRRGQDRLFTRRDRARLTYILMGKRVGFSLDEIREMLDLYEPGDRKQTQLQAARDKIEERIGRLRAQRDEIDRVTGELAHAAKMLGAMLARREDQTV